MQTAEVPLRLEQPVLEVRPAPRPWAVVGFAQVRFWQPDLTAARVGSQAMARAQRVPAAAAVLHVPPWEAERAVLRQPAGATVVLGWCLGRTT